MPGASPTPARSTSSRTGEAAADAVGPAGDRPSGSAGAGRIRSASRWGRCDGAQDGCRPDCSGVGAVLPSRTERALAHVSALPFARSPLTLARACWISARSRRSRGRARPRAGARGERVVGRLELHDDAAVVAHPDPVDRRGILVHPASSKLTCGRSGPAHSCGWAPARATTSSPPPCC
jgi:hypothetical protein